MNWKRCMFTLLSGSSGADESSSDNGRSFVACISHYARRWAVTRNISSSPCWTVLGLWVFIAADALHAESLSLRETSEVTQESEFTRALDQMSEFTIAVLPVQNSTVDPEAAHYLRAELAARAEFKGYTLMSLEIVDESLNRLGVAHAGQLQLLTFDQLRSVLGADGVLSAVVEQAAVQHAGVFNSYVFTASVKLQTAHNGEVVWAVLSERIARRHFALDPLNAMVDVLLVRRGGDTQAAMAYLAQQVLSTLPDGPRTVAIGDSLLDRSTEIVIESGDELKQ